MADPLLPPAPALTPATVKRFASPFRAMFKERLAATPSTLAEYVERVAALACIAAHRDGQRAAGVELPDMDAAYDYAAEYTHSSFTEEIVAKFAPPAPPQP